MRSHTQNECVEAAVFTPSETFGPNRALHADHVDHVIKVEEDGYFIFFMLFLIRPLCSMWKCGASFSLLHHYS